ncbi:hypothetical protein PFISCL1PPCAC_9481, partial [Pristionchus fissidentatus]
MTPTHRWILLLAVVCVGATLANNVLIHVQVVIRHGDRAAQDYFATDDSARVLFRGLGELSDDGIDNAHKQGLDFKKKYVDTGFINASYIPSEIVFRASAVPRVLMSAGSFSNALFRKTPEGGYPIIPPIMTKEYKDDALLAPALDCEDGWDDIVDAMKLPNSTNVAGQSLNKMESEMWPESCKDVPSEKVDAIIAELPNKAIKMSDPYVNCAKDPARKFMYEYLELLGGSGSHRNEMRLKRTVGLLTNELLANINTTAACKFDNDCLKKNPKMRVYYSHDVNVLALSDVFDSISKFENVNPAFSSALVFELYRNSATGYHYVHVLLKNGQDAEFVDTGLCETKEGCHIDAFRARAKKFAIQEPMPCDHTQAEKAKKEEEEKNKQ